jgi:hypothetical protein
MRVTQESRRVSPSAILLSTMTGWSREPAIARREPVG